MLTAEIEDENGIWIAGLTPESSIRLQMDGDERIDVTAAYRATGGSDTAGSISMRLPTLSPGPHHATLFVSDNLGYAASASLDFEVIEAPILRLTDFRAGPNPTREGADVAFLLDIPAEPASSPCCDDQARPSTLRASRRTRAARITRNRPHGWKSSSTWARSSAARYSARSAVVIVTQG